jgi:hypothetical protein
MTTDKIRGILAILVTIGILLPAIVLVLQQVFTGEAPNLDIIKNWSTLWTGILGVIIGYYFGKKD